MHLQAPFNYTNTPGIVSQQYKPIQESSQHNHNYMYSPFQTLKTQGPHYHVPVF